MSESSQGQVVSGKGSAHELVWRGVVWLCLIAPGALIAHSLWGSAGVPRGDLWVSLANGRAIVAALPGLPSVDSLLSIAPSAPGASRATWLSDLLLWSTYRVAGEAGLRGLHVMLFVAFYSILAVRIVRATRERTIAAPALALAAVAYREMIAPGATMFIPLLSLVAYPMLFKAPWPAFAALGVLWANLHPSFLALVPAVAVAGILRGSRSDTGRWRIDVEALRKDPGTWRRPLAVLVGTCLTPSGAAGYPLAWDLLRAGNLDRIAGWGAPLLGAWELAGDTVIALSIAASPVAMLFFLVAALAVTRAALVARAAPATIPAVMAVLVACFFAGRFEPLAWLLFLALGTSVAWVDEVVARFRERPAKVRAQPRTLALGAAGVIFGIVYWGNGLSSQVARAFPSRAAAFLVEAGFGGEVATEAEWRGFLRFHVPALSRVTADKTSGLALVRSRSEAPVERAGRERLVLYENNLAALMAPASDAALVARAATYYTAKKVPFDVRLGYHFGDAHKKATHWTNMTIEAPELGRRPERWLTTEAALRDTAYFHTREVGILAIYRLRSARLSDPSNVRLALANAELLAQTEQWSDASEILDIMERVSVPRDALPKLQALRFEVERRLATRQRPK